MRSHVLAIMKLATTALAASSFLAITPVAVSALLIDDFESGAFSVSDTTADGNSVVHAQSEAVLGGSREILVALLVGTMASASLTTTAGPDSATVSSGASSSTVAAFYYDGVADGNIAVNAPSALNVNLSAAGDRFLLDITSISGAVSVSVLLNDADTLASSNALNVTTAGAHEFPFSLWTDIDFTAVTRIQISFQNMSSSESISIGGFSAVPEPSTALLLAIGLIAVGRSRSRH
jgi:PEP-CTERM motif